MTRAVRVLIRSRGEDVTGRVLRIDGERATVHVDGYECTNTFPVRDLVYLQRRDVAASDAGSLLGLRGES